MQLAGNVENRPKMNYHFLKMKAIKEGEYGYDINLKIKKINQINQINQ